MKRHRQYLPLWNKAKRERSGWGHDDYIEEFMKLVMHDVARKSKAPDAISTAARSPGDVSIDAWSTLSPFHAIIARLDSLSLTFIISSSPA